ncbi:hypothetical protein YDYSY3_60670 [Paenibacillus chitinolyticus]|uniref:hypothetical protein n=1 Tax=Paenibacillus chitinolyticus TaxID=79263 RepID=UPI0026E4AFC7|nr:hypothetical protein [Paenibacillus chitinolyticus]GKS15067.1 hypothetical protein YDYSY3_60670 [Paenibacillus chitinolyticus]
MEHKKLIGAFKKEIDKLKKDTISEDDIKEWHNLIKESIQNDLKDGHKDTIARNLTLGIGVHAGEYPKYLILNGEKEGWKYITRFLLWEEHILQKLFDYKEVSPRTIGCIIGLSMLWEMTDLSKRSREYFQIIFESNNDNYAQKETHHLFMALLHDLYHTEQINQELYAVLPEQNVYRKFLDNWYNADKELLGNLIFEICDLHIYSSLDLKNKFSEILSLNYIPYDVRLIEKIRQEHGLTTVQIEHPLLATPLANIPKFKYEWDLSKDEVYQYLLRRE